MIYHEGTRIRSHWHWAKFERMRETLGPGAARSVLDVGCAAGTFLGLLAPEEFPVQVGVDLDARQIDYARQRYGRAWRRFVPIAAPEDILALGRKFDVVTMIELLEHLAPEQIARLLSIAWEALRPGGLLAISTPNYLSTWPLVERVLNLISDVSYEEQHITKLDYFRIERQLAAAWPAFGDKFRTLFRTTSHLVSPWIAGAAPRRARALAQMIQPKRWRIPLGNIVIYTARRL